MSTQWSTQCQIMVNYLSNKYWEILFWIGINGGERSLDEIINKMFIYDGDNQITQHNPIFARIRDAPGDKERNEHLLDFLKKKIRDGLSRNDLGLSVYNRCNFLGDDPDDIANWGKEGGPHYDGGHIDDFLKHHYPFLNPLRSRLPSRTISFPSEEPNSHPETTFGEPQFTFGTFDAPVDLTPSSPSESEGTTSTETKEGGYKKYKRKSRRKRKRKKKRKTFLRKRPFSKKGRKKNRKTKRKKRTFKKRKLNKKSRRNRKTRRRKSRRKSRRRKLRKRKSRKKKGGATCSNLAECSKCVSHKKQRGTPCLWNKNKTPKCRSRNTFRGRENMRDGWTNDCSSTSNVETKNKVENARVDINRNMTPERLNKWNASREKTLKLWDEFNSKKKEQDEYITEEELNNMPRAHEWVGDTESNSIIETKIPIANIKKAKIKKAKIKKANIIDKDGNKIISI